MDYYDESLSPRPDRHGEFAYPINSSDDVLPAVDEHGHLMYPLATATDTQPKADSHENTGFDLHKGSSPFDHTKPGSFHGSGENDGRTETGRYGR